jgi:hypothetical protein
MLQIILFWPFRELQARHIMKTVPIRLIWVLCVIAAPAWADDTGPLQAVTSEAGVLIREGEQNVLFYQRATQSQDGTRPRANYIHPLYDLDGDVLTEDFPSDHLHHRGIFWAWHQVLVGDKPVGDPWSCENFVWDVKDVAVDREDDSSLALKAHVVWKSPRWTDESSTLKPLVDERTVIRVHRESGDARAIDFEIALRAIEKALRLGGSDDEKGYGGFSVRVRLPEGVRFIGEQGEVEPETTSVEAGPWLDVAARYGDGDTEGVAILCHPSNPGFPQPWILRRSRSMQNPAYPGRTPVALSIDEPLMLRYRLVIHRGEADRERLNAWFREYAEAK